MCVVWNRKQAESNESNSNKLDRKNSNNNNNNGHYFNSISRLDASAFRRILNKNCQSKTGKMLKMVHRGFFIMKMCHQNRLFTSIDPNGSQQCSCVIISK